MISRQMPIYLTIFLLLISLSGCTQSPSESGEKTGSDGTGAIPIDTQAADAPDTQSADNQAVSEIQGLVTFEGDICNAAEKAKTCETRLIELGIVSKDDCCQTYSKCC